MFFSDVMNHLQALSLSLQGKDKIVSDLAQIIFFRIKLNCSREKLIQNLYNTSYCLKDLSILKMNGVQKR